MRASLSAMETSEKKKDWTGLGKLLKDDIGRMGDLLLQALMTEMEGMEKEV